MQYLHNEAKFSKSPHQSSKKVYGDVLDKKIITKKLIVKAHYELQNHTFLSVFRTFSQQDLQQKLQKQYIGQNTFFYLWVLGNRLDYMVLGSQKNIFGKLRSFLKISEKKFQKNFFLGGSNGNWLKVPNVKISSAVG